jgi:GNAT superfamily N-acetyltransferase
MEMPLTKSSISVRQATESDLAVFTELRGLLWADQIKKGSLDNPNTEPAQLLADTSKLLTRRRTTVFLAMRDGHPAGYAYNQIKGLPGGTDFIVGSVEEIFVREKDRRRGLATELAKKALQEFKKEGVNRIQLRVLDSNTEGRSFWVHMGFLPNTIMYEYPMTLIESHATSH